MARSVRATGIAALTSYRWRREFVGLESDRVRKLEDLETENVRLRIAVPDYSAPSADTSVSHSHLTSEQNTNILVDIRWETEEEER